MYASEVLLRYDFLVSRAGEWAEACNKESTGKYSPRMWRP
jgi:hypothetical protein